MIGLLSSFRAVGLQEGGCRDNDSCIRGSRSPAMNLCNADLCGKDTHVAEQPMLVCSFKFSMSNILLQRDRHWTDGYAPMVGIAGTVQPLFGADPYDAVLYQAVTVMASYIPRLLDHLGKFTSVPRPVLVCTLPRHPLAYAVYAACWRVIVSHELCTCRRLGIGRNMI